jgi:glutamate synthase domain-containing protein 2
LRCPIPNNPHTSPGACRPRSPRATTAARSTTSTARSATGLYEIRGLGAKRKLPHFDDLVFLAASLSRYPLEGYREKCSTKTVLGTRFAKKPVELDIPITIAGMSFGALSANVKEALGRPPPPWAPPPPPATAA